MIGVDALAAAIAISVGVFGANDSERYTIDDVAFIAGHWAGDLFGGRAEEAWLGPDGGTMLGVFRLVVPGRDGTDGTAVTEYLMFTETDTGVVFRFKHFNTDYTTWEEDEPLTFDLVEASEDLAVFASDVQKQPDRMTFRMDDGGRLRVLVEGEENGQRDTFEAVYTRVE